MKKCPFREQECNSECGLFIAVDDLNEFVLGRLRALGIIETKDGGMCSLKNIALAGSRYMFENSEVYRK